MAASPYQFPLKSYCQKYGVSYRTILRWKDSGFPLDDERQTRLLVSTGARFTPQLPANGPRNDSTAIPGALGLSASIARLQQAELATHADYTQARASGDENLAEAKRRQWVSLSEQLRKVEQSTPEIEESNRNSIRVEELDAALGDLFLKLRQDLDSIPKRVSLEIAGKDEITAREVLKREMDEIILALYSCKYLGGQS